MLGIYFEADDIIAISLDAIGADRTHFTRAFSGTEYSYSYAAIITSTTKTNSTL